MTDGIMVALPTELRIIPSATVNEIDMEAFDSFMRARAGRTEYDARPGTDDDLRDAQVCEELDGVLRPTLYGVMVYGRGPQRYRPALRMFVHCRRMGLRGRGWLRMRRGMREFNGTEPELINEVRHRYVRVRFRTPLGTETGEDG